MPVRPFHHRRHQRHLVLALLAACAACGPHTPASSTPPRTADVQLLAFNDFHGHLEPPTGANGRMGDVAAGGIEYLATDLRRLRAANPNTVVVSAGDNIGASPLLSGMFHDEPTIKALSDAGLQVSAPGNHEFDEGWWELFRMQHGGCHPVDGCQDRTPFNGATFQYLAANVVVDPAQVDLVMLARSGWHPPASGPSTLFPGWTVRTVGGVRIGFIGLALTGTPAIVAPASVKGLTFRDGAEAANEAAAALAAQGVHAIVVLIHEGGRQAGGTYDTCEGMAGPILDIVHRMSQDIDVVVSGHTHQAYNCRVDGKLLTSAESYGRLITDIDLRIDPHTDDIVSSTAHNLLVTRDVPKDPAETRLIAHYQPFARELGGRVVGHITAPLTRVGDAAGQSGLGGVVADAYLDAARASGALAAFTNPGGIRNDLVGQPPVSPGGLRDVTYADVFDTLPFGNRVVTRTMTGEAIVRMLEQQFDNPDPGSRKILQVSEGFSYRYDASKPAGSRVERASVRIGGQPLDPATSYRMAASDFLWGGGDGFTAAQQAFDPTDAGVDVDVAVRYFQQHPPVEPAPVTRIQRAP